MHILSALDLSQQSSTLTDVYRQPILGPVFALGTRYIAYATTTFDGFLPNVVSEKDVKGVAKDIAKEVHGVVKSLSEYSYHKISNYFRNNPSPPEVSSSSPTRHRRKSNASNSSSIGDAPQPAGLVSDTKASLKISTDMHGIHASRLWSETYRNYPPFTLIFDHTRIQSPTSHSVPQEPCFCQHPTRATPSTSFILPRATSQ